jgi:hypothetical protein
MRVAGARFVERCDSPDPLPKHTDCTFALPSASEREPALERRAWTSSSLAMAAMAYVNTLVDTRRRSSLATVIRAVRRPR